MEKNMENHMGTRSISPLAHKTVTWGYTGDTERELQHAIGLRI